VDSIIPFLFRYRNSIVDVGKHKTGLLSIEYEYFKSPLVQAVFKDVQFKVQQQQQQQQTSPRKLEIPLRPTKVQQQQQIVKQHDDENQESLSIITQLYSLWEDSKLDPRAQYDLNNLVIKIISPTRYDAEKLLEGKKTLLESVKSTITFWSTCESRIESYIAFVNKYESVLSDPNVALPDNMRPTISNQDQPPDDYSEIL